MRTRPKVFCTSALWVSLLASASPAAASAQPARQARGTAAATRGAGGVPSDGSAGGDGATTVARDGAERADAQLGSLASELDGCSAEASKCLNNVECLECMTSYVDHPLEFEKCLEDYDPAWPNATACDVQAARPCCFDVVSRGSCLADGYFLEYWGCWFAAFHGCPDHELMCDGTDDTDDANGISKAASGTKSSSSSSGVNSSISSSGSGSGSGSVVTDELTAGGARSTFPLRVAFTTVYGFTAVAVTGVLLALL